MEQVHVLVSSMSSLSHNTFYLIKEKFNPLPDDRILDLLQGISPFSHNVFHRCISVVCQNVALCGNGLTSGAKI